MILNLFELIFPLVGHIYNMIQTFPSFEAFRPYYVKIVCHKEIFSNIIGSIGHTFFYLHFCTTNKKLHQQSNYQTIIFSKTYIV